MSMCDVQTSTMTLFFFKTKQTTELWWMKKSHSLPAGTGKLAYLIDWPKTNTNTPFPFTPFVPPFLHYYPVPELFRRIYRRQPNKVLHFFFVSPVLVRRQSNNNNKKLSLRGGRRRIVFLVKRRARWWSATVTVHDVVFPAIGPNSCVCACACACVCLLACLLTWLSWCHQKHGICGDRTIIEETIIHIHIIQQGW